MSGRRYPAFVGMNPAARILFFTLVTLVLAACAVITVGPTALARQWRLSFTEETQPLIQLYFANPVELPTQAAPGALLPVSFWIVRQGGPKSEAIASEILLVEPRHTTTLWAHSLLSRDTAPARELISIRVPEVAPGLSRLEVLLPRERQNIYFLLTIT